MSGLAITGARGTIGGVLLAALADRGPLGIDLPEVDLRDPAAARASIKGCESVVHLAWDTHSENFALHTFCADNVQMTFNVVSACLAEGARRLVFASSVHAHGYWPPGAYGQLELDVGTPAGERERAAVPDSPYGAAKLFGEALCRWAATRGLECVCLRFGGVNPADAPPQDEGERRVWLSHRDCAAVVARALDAPLRNRYAVVTAVSNNVGRLHAIGNALGFAPRDGAPAVASAPPDRAREH